MAGLLAVGPEGWAPLYHDVQIQTSRFRVWRRFECSRLHRWIPLLIFSQFGQRLDNPAALRCPYCSLEGACVG